MCARKMNVLCNEELQVTSNFNRLQVIKSNEKSNLLKDSLVTMCGQIKRADWYEYRTERIPGFGVDSFPGQAILT